MILLNGSPINVTIFPDKTSQVWKIPEEILKQSNYIHITWEFESEAEFMHLAQLKMLFDAEGYFKYTLRLKYLPYGRQDKAITNSNTFALRTFAKLLNTLEFDEVIIHDPHSEIALKTINNSVAKYPIEKIYESAKNTETSIFCYPDEGAFNKYTKVLVKNPLNLGHIHAIKKRNQLTGIIEKYELFGSANNQNVLIVDDICDGGATFILVAKALYEAGAKEVNLFVSHGIFSNGIKPLLDAGINRIFTKDGEVTVLV